MAPELRSRSAPNENGAAATVTDSLAASTPVDSGHTAANAVHSAKAERKAAKRKAAEDADPDWPPQKTLLRGVLHQHMALAALTAGIMLVATAPGTRAKIGCGIYAGEICQCCMPSDDSSGSSSTRAGMQPPGPRRRRKAVHGILSGTTDADSWHSPFLQAR